MTARATILGAAGAMGSLFSRRLQQDGCEVAGFDLRAPADQSSFASFVAGDVLNLSDASRAMVTNADCVVICLPEPQAMEWVKRYASLLAAKMLVVDTMSVKTPITQLVQSLSLASEYLSINPMFAPSLGFEGQKVVAVPLRDGPGGAAFCESMRRWGSTIVSMDADRHDRACAMMQVATHIMLLALGEAVRGSGLKVDELVSIAPPPHLVCMGLIARILKAAPETYWDIQRYNPRAEEARRQLMSALESFDSTVNADDPVKFAAALKSLRESFGSSLDPLATLAARAIDAIKSK